MLVLRKVLSMAAGTTPRCRLCKACRLLYPWPEPAVVNAGKHAICCAAFPSRLSIAENLLHCIINLTPRLSRRSKAKTNGRKLFPPALTCVSNSRMRTCYAQRRK
jgi:hypothetical protein